MKHTKGTWKLGGKPSKDQDKVNFLHEIYVNSTLIASINWDCKSDLIKPEIAAANAKLIAASPDLLDALIEINGLYGDRDGNIEEYKSAWDNVTNAIKKATE